MTSLSSGTSSSSSHGLHKLPSSGSSSTSSTSSSLNRHSKNTGRTQKTKKKTSNSGNSGHSRKDSREDPGDPDALFEPVDFTKLELPSLKKYKRYYKLRTRSNSNKAELVQAISRHFQSMGASETSILETFIYLIKRRERKAKG